MSGFPSGGEALGSASFGLHADGLAAFEREMAAAGNAVDNFDQRASQAAIKGGFFGRMKGQLAAFDAGLVKFIGPLLRIVGLASLVATTFYTIGNWIGNKINPGVKEWEDAMKRVNTQNERAAELYQKQFGDVNIVDSKSKLKRLAELDIELQGGTNAERNAIIAGLKNAKATQAVMGAAAPVATFGPSNSPAALGAMMRRSRGGGL